MSTVQLLNGTWSDVDHMLKEHNNRVKMALYNTADEVLTITAGTPVSPGTNISTVTGTTPEGSTYDGDIQINPGIATQELKFDATFSNTSDTNNVVVTGFITVNGVTQVQKVLRKITTGSDVGALGFNAVVVAGGGDTIGFSFDIDAGTADITVKAGASWVFETFRVPA